MKLLVGGKKLTGWGKNGPAYFFPGERMGRPILSPGKKLTGGKFWPVTPGLSIVKRVFDCHLSGVNRTRVKCTWLICITWHMPRRYNVLCFDSNVITALVIYIQRYVGCKLTFVVNHLCQYLSSPGSNEDRIFLICYIICHKAFHPICVFKMLMR